MRGRRSTCPAGQHESIQTYEEYPYRDETVLKRYMEKRTPKCSSTVAI